MFQLWLENKRDEEFRKEAAKIADAIIQAIDDASADKNGKPKSYENKGIEKNWQKPSSYEFNIGEFLPDHPKLKLNFVNQPGFGKNKHLGTYNFGIISVAIPKRTLYAQGNFHDINWTGSWTGKHPTNRYRFPDAVVRWLKKPDVYDTMIHEIIHYLDSKRTKGKIFKNYPYENKPGYSIEKYYNHPSEYNANLHAFLVAKIDRNKNSMQYTLELVKKEEWFQQLNDNLKRKVFRRIGEYYGWKDNHSIP